MATAVLKRAGKPRQREDLFDVGDDNGVTIR